MPSTFEALPRRAPILPVNSLKAAAMRYVRHLKVVRSTWSSIAAMPVKACSETFFIFSTGTPSVHRSSAGGSCERSRRCGGGLRRYVRTVAGYRSSRRQLRWKWSSCSDANCRHRHCCPLPPAPLRRCSGCSDERAATRPQAGGEGGAHTRSHACSIQVQILISMCPALKCSKLEQAGTKRPGVCTNQKAGKETLICHLLLFF